MVRDSIDGALQDLATFYRDVMLVQAGSMDALINSDLSDEIEKCALGTWADSSTKKLDAIMQTRTQLAMNTAPLTSVEALMCRLAQP
jgi:DNA polymerase-3 subunit delta'